MTLLQKAKSYLRIVMFLITCRFYPSGEAFGTASDDATVSIPNSSPLPPPPKKNKNSNIRLNIMVLIRN